MSSTNQTRPFAEFWWSGSCPPLVFTSIYGVLSCFLPLHFKLLLEFVLYGIIVKHPSSSTRLAMITVFDTADSRRALREPTTLLRAFGLVRPDSPQPSSWTLCLKARIYLRTCMQKGSRVVASSCTAWSRCPRLDCGIPRLRDQE